MLFPRFYFCNLRRIITRLISQQKMNIFLLFPWTIQRQVNGHFSSPVWLCITSSCLFGLYTVHFSTFGEHFDTIKAHSQKIPVRLSTVLENGHCWPLFIFPFSIQFLQQLIVNKLPMTVNECQKRLLYQLRPNHCPHIL